MRLAHDVKPITFLKNRTAEVVREVARGRTLLITQNGEAKMVVLGVAEYDRQQAAQALLGILQQSEADAVAGRVVAQDEMFRKLEADLKRSGRRSAARPRR